MCAESRKPASADDRFRQDIDYLFEKLRKHPLFIREPQKLAQFCLLYEKICPKTAPLNRDSLIDTATELTMFFEDGHTNMEIPYTRTDRLLLLHCDWDESGKDRLTVTERFEDIPAGADLISLEGFSIGELISAMASRIPHENRHLVKSRMLHYPYANYHLFSEANLKRLFGKKEKYSATFQVNGIVKTKELPLTFYDGYPGFKEDDPFSYEAENGSLTIHIDACVYNREYLDFLDECALLCRENKIENVVLDLSRNMGGSSAVIEPFIRHTDVDSYKIYEMLDYSSGIEEIVCRRDEVHPNQKAEILFPQKISCKVSMDTFSSARTFAVTLLDNGIAAIIGDQMGGKPNSFGLPKKDTMKNTGIRFRVSTCYFSRPNALLDEELTS